MHNHGKSNILGVLIDAVDYEGAVELVAGAAREKKALTVSALAVHGLMTGALDREQKFRLNHFDVLAPDGQPVRWVLNALYGTKLPDRVNGPKLMVRVCARAAQEGFSVFFYGSTPETLDGLRSSILDKFPNLTIAGMAPSKFRRLNAEEKIEVAARIRNSGASIVFVGLGCPRQETFTYEFRDLLPMPVLAVGAAFPMVAGTLPQAPMWMQNLGLEWVYRLFREPRRLWRRYLLLNPAYVFLVALQALRLSRFSPEGQSPRMECMFG
jgi:N-acetylglucosaminyldiphosphoundecaprenol N-acetyl-beta-D-mannosaminyltransferase